MSFYTGHGGKLTVGSTDYSVATWRLRKFAVLADTTNSGGGGYQSFLKVVRGSEGSVECVWDSGTAPEGTIDEGTAVTLKLYRGASGTYFSVPSVIETLEFVCDNKTDAVRFSVTFKGTGAVTIT